MINLDYVRNHPHFKEQLNNSFPEITKVYVYLNEGNIEDLPDDRSFQVFTCGVLLCMQEIDFKDKVVVDAGCGNGVFGIYALLKGAKKVYFLDFNKKVQSYVEETIDANNLLADKADFSMLGELFSVLENKERKSADIVVANLEDCGLPTQDEPCKNNDVESLLALFSPQYLIVSGNYEVKEDLISFCQNKGYTQYAEVNLEGKFLGAIFEKSIVCDITFSDIKKYLKENGSLLRIVVPAASSESVIEAISLFIKEFGNQVQCILVGDTKQISNISSKFNLEYSSAIEPGKIFIVSAIDDKDALEKSMQIVKNKQADIILKGRTPTDQLMRAILAHNIIPKGIKITHHRLFAKENKFDDNGSPWAIEEGDGGINILSTLEKGKEEKIEKMRDVIRKHGIELMRLIGIPSPKLYQFNSKLGHTSIKEAIAEKTRVFVHNWIGPANISYKAKAMDLPWKLKFKQVLNYPSGKIYILGKQDSSENIFLVGPESGISFEEKNNILNTAINLEKDMNSSYSKIKVALVNFTDQQETFKNDIPSIADAVGLKNIFANNKGVIVEGPMSYDEAISKKATEIKGLVSEVGGNPDILFLPDRESADILADIFIHWDLMGYPWKAADHSFGGDIQVVIAPRSESGEFKYRSLITSAYFLLRKREVANKDNQIIGKIESGRTLQSFFINGQSGCVSIRVLVTLMLLLICISIIVGSIYSWWIYLLGVPIGILFYFKLNYKKIFNKQIKILLSDLIDKSINLSSLLREKRKKGIYSAYYDHPESGKKYEKIKQDAKEGNLSERWVKYYILQYSRSIRKEEVALNLLSNLEKILKKDKERHQDKKTQLFKYVNYLTCRSGKERKTDYPYELLPENYDIFYNINNRILLKDKRKRPLKKDLDKRLSNLLNNLIIRIGKWFLTNIELRFPYSYSRRKTIIGLMSLGLLFSGCINTKTSLNNIFEEEKNRLLTITVSEIKQKIIKEADYILSCQYMEEDRSKGAINNVYGKPTWVVPRENAWAIISLVRASKFLDDKKYIERAELCADYLIKIQDSDGGWFNQYSYDKKVSKDDPNWEIAWAKSITQTAQVIIALGELGFNKDRYLALKKGAEFILECQNPNNKGGRDDGLVGGGKNFKGEYERWRWVSDNSFSYIALMVVSRWAELIGDLAFAQECENVAKRIIFGINNYFYIKDKSRKDYGLWYRIVDENDNPVDSDFHDWLNYAPLMLGIPVEGIKKDIAGKKIHYFFQKDNGACVWDDGKYRYRLSPGFTLQACLAWLRLNDEFSLECFNRGINWLVDSELWHRDGGFIDWQENNTTAPSWQRFIDTSAYAILVFSGDIEFTNKIDNKMISSTNLSKVRKRLGNKRWFLPYLLNLFDKLLNIKQRIIEEREESLGININRKGENNYLAGYHQGKIKFHPQANLLDKLLCFPHEFIHLIIDRVHLKISKDDEELIVSIIGLILSLPVLGLFKIIKSYRLLSGKNIKISLLRDQDEFINERLIKLIEFLEKNMGNYKDETLFNKLKMIKSKAIQETPTNAGASFEDDIEINLIDNLQIDEFNKYGFYLFLIHELGHKFVKFYSKNIRLSETPDTNIISECCAFLFELLFRKTVRKNQNDLLINVLDKIIENKDCLESHREGAKLLKELISKEKHLSSLFIRMISLLEHINYEGLRDVKLFKDKFNNIETDKKKINFKLTKYIRRDLKNFSLLDNRTISYLEYQLKQKLPIPSAYYENILFYPFSKNYGSYYEFTEEPLPGITTTRPILTRRRSKLIDNTTGEISTIFIEQVTHTDEDRFIHLQTARLKWGNPKEEFFWNNRIFPKEYDYEGDYREKKYFFVAVSEEERVEGTISIIPYYETVFIYTIEKAPWNRNVRENKSKKDNLMKELLKEAFRFAEKLGYLDKYPQDYLAVSGSGNEDCFSKLGAKVKSIDKIYNYPFATNFGFTVKDIKEILAIDKYLNTSSWVEKRNILQKLPENTSNLLAWIYPIAIMGLKEKFPETELNEIQWNAARLLQKFPTEKAVPYLVGLIKRSKHTFVIKESLKALGFCVKDFNDELKDLFIQILKDKNNGEYIKEACWEALAEIEHPSARDLLRKISYLRYGQAVTKYLYNKFAKESDNGKLKIDSLYNIIIPHYPDINHYYPSLPKDFIIGEFNTALPEKLNIGEYTQNGIRIKKDLLIAAKEGKIVGQIYYEVKENLSSAEKEAYLVYIGVIQEMRRQKIGTNLFMTLLDKLKKENIDKLIISSIENTENARGFWKYIFNTELPHQGKLSIDISNF
ncbi:MAG: GNAT family N-acetyltransferase [Candidatus Omnitrophica bacterium]|nr:GNAT family N-acetyltransferase [Candidatus Omnitrophota bacterium]